MAEFLRTWGPGFDHEGAGGGGERDGRGSTICACGQTYDPRRCTHHVRRVKGSPTVERRGEVQEALGWTTSLMFANNEISYILWGDTPSVDQAQEEFVLVHACGQV